MQRDYFKAERSLSSGTGLFLAGLFFLVGCATPELPPLAEATIVTSATAATPVPQPSAGVDKPLGLDEALGRAEAGNAQLQALRAAVAVAKERKAAASDFEEPEALGAWGSIADEFSDSPASNKKEWRVGGKFYVPNPFLIVPRVSARTADWLAAQADLQAGRWLVQCEVRRSFAELDYLSEDLALAEEIVRQSSEILKDVRVRAEQGAATASDVIAAGQKQLQTQDDLDQTRHRYQLAQRELAMLLGLPAGALQIVTNALSWPGFPQGMMVTERLERAALHSRGDLTALRWRTMAAKSASREAANLRVPWVKEITLWDREPAQQWWLAGALTVPIFSWSKNHARDVVEAQYHLARVNETNGFQLICRELRGALAEVETQQHQQTRNQMAVVPLLAEMRQTLAVLRSTPRLMPSQVAQTEAQIVESSRLELAGRWRYHLALLNLERAVGEPLADALESPERNR